MYVPAEHATSTTAIGPLRVRVVPRHEIERVDRHARASASSTVSPARAIAYARRPPTLIALYAGGRCEIVPVNPASAASTAARIGRRTVGRRQLALEVVGRRRRAEADRRAVRLPVAEVVLDDARRVAEEHRQDARRERVERPAVADPLRRGQPPDERRRRRATSARPAWRRRGCRRARGRATSGPSSAVRARRRAGAASARTARPRASASGASTVAPAARAWPPPPNAPVSTVASTPPGLVRTLIRVAGAGLLEQDRDLGRLGLRRAGR